MSLNKKIIYTGLLVIVALAIVLVWLQTRKDGYGEPEEAFEDHEDYADDEERFEDHEDYAEDEERFEDREDFELEQEGYEGFGNGYDSYETFDDSPEDKREHVVEMFKVLLDRSPTLDEIETYADLPTKKVISHKIIKDHGKGKGKGKGKGTKTKTGATKGAKKGATGASQGAKPRAKGAKKGAKKPAAGATGAANTAATASAPNTIRVAAAVAQLKAAVSNIDSMFK